MKYIKYIIHLFYVRVHVWNCSSVPLYMWKPEGILWEWVLSLHHVDLGVELRLLGLAAGSFTSSATLPSIPLLTMITNVFLLPFRPCPQYPSALWYSVERIRGWQAGRHGGDLSAPRGIRDPGVWQIQILREAADLRDRQRPLPAFWKRLRHEFQCRSLAPQHRPPLH